MQTATVKLTLAERDELSPALAWLLARVLLLAATAAGWAATLTVKRHGSPPSVFETQSGVTVLFPCVQPFGHVHFSHRGHLSLQTSACGLPPGRASNHGNSGLSQIVPFWVPVSPSRCRSCSEPAPRAKTEIIRATAITTLSTGGARAVLPTLPRKVRSASGNMD